MFAIVTEDNVKFSIEHYNIIKCSEFLKDIVSDYEEEDDIEIPLSIDSKTFQKILEYMTYIVENKPSEIEKPMKKNFRNYVSKWEFDFINVSIEELEKIINSSNYLNIKCLLNLSCAFLVSKIQNKKIEEIREILNIENDFSPEEEEKIKLENKWISDI
jgi:S-phase kinase-associated protein 1